MRKLACMLLVLAPLNAWPCVMSQDVPVVIQEKGIAAVRLYLMQERWRSAAAVFEGTVISTTHNRDEGQPILRAKLDVGRVWKTDGGDLSVVETSYTSCGANLHVGRTYVIFAGRDDSFWSFLPWIDEPLGTGLNGAVWIGPYGGADPEEIALHQQYTLEPLAVVLNAPELARTPSN